MSLINSHFIIFYSTKLYNHIKEDCDVKKKNIKQNFILSIPIVVHHEKSWKMEGIEKIPQIIKHETKNIVLKIGRLKINFEQNKKVKYI